MDGEELRKEVEKVIRSSEIKAVARALKSGHSLQVGETIDYVIEPPPSACDHGTPARVPGTRPYQLVIEFWHLEAAQQMLAEV
jgi:hypothetical protein